MKNILDEKIYDIILNKEGAVHPNAIPDLICVLYSILDKALKNNIITCDNPDLFNSLVALNTCLETTFSYIKGREEDYQKLSSSQLKNILTQLTTNKTATIIIDGQKRTVTRNDLFVRRDSVEEFEKKMQEKSNDKQ